MSAGQVSTKVPKDSTEIDYIYQRLSELTNKAQYATNLVLSFGERFKRKEANIAEVNHSDRDLDVKQSTNDHLTELNVKIGKLDNIISILEMEAERLDKLA